MRKRIAFYVGLLLTVICLCSSCSEESSIQLPEEQEKLTMKDVLQMYLDAGFEIDPTATLEGESFATPEEALATLNEWKEWKVLNESKPSTRQSIVNCKLEYGPLPMDKDITAYWFLYRQFQISFHAGKKVDFNSLHAVLYGTPPPCTFVEALGVTFEGVGNAGNANGPDITFFMGAEVCATFEILGVRIREEHIVIQAYCTTNLKDKKVQIVELSGYSIPINEK